MTVAKPEKIFYSLSLRTRKRIIVTCILARLELSVRPSVRRPFSLDVLDFEGQGIKVKVATRSNF